jgi:FkbM family methyltransferase
METKLKKIIWTYRTSGLKGIVKKFFAYITNYRVRRENFIWFFKRLHMGSSEPTTKVHGLKYYIHSSDPGISKELAVYHIHEPVATKIFKNQLSEGMYEIDIGSNLGYYALLAGCLVGSKGKILAIEPEPNNYRLLSNNVQRNNLENVITIQCAVGKKDGISEFFLTEASNTNSLITPINGRIISAINVKTRKLDTLIKDYAFPRIDLIRMDIEGGEIIAIEGMYTILKQFKPKILIELHCDVAGTDSINNLLSIYEDYGYGVDCIIDRDKDFVWQKNQTVLKPASMNELYKSIPNYRVATVLLK